MNSKISFLDDSDTGTRPNPPLPMGPLMPILNTSCASNWDVQSQPHYDSAPLSRGESRSAESLPSTAEPHQFDLEDAPKFELGSEPKEDINLEETTKKAADIDDSGETPSRDPQLISKTSKASTTGTSGPPRIQKRASILDLGLKVKEVSKSVKMAAEDELRYEALRFAHSTTAHGIPMVCFPCIVNTSGSSRRWLIVMGRKFCGHSMSWRKLNELKFLTKVKRKD